MRLRTATSADLPMLHHWGTQPHVVAAGGGGWPWDDMVCVRKAWREILIAETGGAPVGVLQIMDPDGDEERYWGDCGPNLRCIDIFIGDVAETGRGLGTQMMRLALARCFAVPEVTAVLIDPKAENTRSHRFYRRLGFVFVERRRFCTSDCFVFRLTRAAWRQGDQDA